MIEKTSTPQSKKIIRNVFIAVFLVTLSVTGCVNHEMKKFRGTFSEKAYIDDIQPLKGTYIIKNVHVLSEDGASMRNNQQVLISGHQIEAIAPIIKAPAEQVVDGGGMFLIPGLMDGHVHISENPNNLLLNLANGVTHIRDMGGNAYHLNLKKEEATFPLRPMLFTTTEKVYSCGGIKAWFIEWTRTRICMGSVKEAEKIVSEAKADGFDALKVGNGLEAEHYWALLKAAKSADLGVTGHIPSTITLEQFLESGQYESAHVEEFTKVMIREFGWINAETEGEFIEHVKRRSFEIAPIIQKKGMAVTSVIWLMESLPQQKFNLEGFLKTIELEYMDPAKVEGTRLARGWLPGHHSYAVDDAVMNDPERRKLSEIFWRNYVKAIHIMTKALIDEHVILMAGTDAITTGAVPGFALHDELESLVKVGMSPAQSLQSATRVPGKWLGNKTGQMKNGYKANLVLLRKNPLTDIRHTRSIESVIINGQLLNRQQLDTILERIRMANNETRTIDISDYQK
ncbi:amidohydrolase family protein [Marinicella sp. W31]|uniref:amidohydrolase family protein n=1 Tax=Marinicella sp. W31 TaxID=3023713 RepID=UPI003757F37F